LTYGKASPEKKGDSNCKCPFCDAPVEKAYPFCKTCGKDFNRCSVCGKVIAEDRELCPECEEQRSLS
jgi:predicted amidophosphoribosyltransferase